MIAAPTVTFIPCCNRGEGIIFIDTVPLLSTNLVDGATYRYLGGPATGQGLGPLGIDTLVSGQCYTLIFGVSPSVYPILPTFIVPSTFASTGNSCLHPACPECSPEQPFTNKYLQFVPCCDEDDIILFRLPPSNIPTAGVAIYAGGVSGSPYVSTDKFGNLSTPLFSNLCYSITDQFAGPGSSITNATEYNNLQIAPAEIAGNYSYLSTVNTDCSDFSAECPSCNPLCFTLWSCNGITSSQPLFTTSTDLTAFVGTNIVVSSLDPDDNIVEICVFVQNTTEFNCTNAIEVVVDSESCECDCTCYTIIGEIKSVEWIDCFGVYHLVATPLSPFEICAGAYPLALPLVANNPLQVINNGLCIESTIFNDETCEEETEFNCKPACYLLEDCLDNTNVIYSNSTSLLGPANLGQIVTIAGYTECWKVLIPESCDCPINVTVTQVHNCCEACLPNINYKLTSCKDSTAFTYTSDDLSLYVDRVIRREDCPEECWIVSEIDGNIPTDTPIVILENYLDCEKCYRKYYSLEDCLGLQNGIITYTDLSLYVDKVITLDWCPETCWEVSETINDDGAGIISDILNTYNLCIDCLTNAPCICSTIKNYNTISQIYKYLDCYGLLQSVTLQPNQKSNRLCLIRWYAPEPCDELIVTITSSTGVVSNITVYQNSVTHPGPVFVNDKPTWNNAGNTLYIYYDGTKWILSKNLNPLIVPAVYTTIGFINCNGDCDCPTGTWQQSSSIPNQDVYVTTELKYTIEYFGNCINGVCPPIKNKQKSVTPGYNTPGCEAWKYEEISCRAAEAMYKQVLELRYGISNCCPEEDEQYIVQKELIDLAALYDPAYPCATNSCGCNNDCNCSTAEPVCPPIPLTYNCFCTQSACECIEIGNGSGEYSTLALCQAACVPLPITSYNCTNGTCVLVSGPGGQYSTLAACEENCTPLPIISYNCIDNTCVDPGDGTGQYSTLLACEEECVPTPVTTYDCIDGECVEVQGSGGQFPTYINCYDNLVITNNSCEDKVYTGVTIISLTDPYSWVAINHPNNNFDNYTFSCNNCGFCTSSNSCPSPDNGCLVYCSFVTVVNTSGLLFTAYTANDLINYLNTNYPSCGPFLLSDTFAEINAILGSCPESENTNLNYITGICTCDTACVPLPLTSYNCVDGSCVNPGDGSGEYPTLLECQAACIPTTSWNCVDCECVSVSGSGGTYPTEIDCLESTCSQFFITTWQTTEATESIALPYLNSGTYSGTIDWGDGGPTSVNSYANRVHVYAVAGTYTVTICGDVIGWNFSLVPNSRLNIRTVVQWGQLQLAGNGSYFQGCSNLDLSLVSDILDLTGITNMFGMFSLCTSLTTINNINSWDTSAITGMAGMFADCTSFNQPLSFNTSAVTNMFSMFYNCQTFNSALTFNTIAVTDMTQMFQFCINFNQPLTFNTIAVTTMIRMFIGCSVFNSTLTFTTTALVQNMYGMFQSCNNFNQPLNFNTVSVTDMGSMFRDATAFNQPLIFNTVAVTDMANMFQDAPAFNQNIGTWNISNVVNFGLFMFGKTPATWPTTYFDNLLCGWSPQTVNPILIIDFGTANYTNATGGPCRTILQGAPNNWTINSGPGV